MGKSATLNLRVNPEVKEQAEAVLEKLGVPMSTAVDIFLRQVSLTGGIPFYVKLPPAPVSINADYMTADEIRTKLKKGYDDVEAGRVYVAAEAFEEFGRKIKWKSTM